MKRTAFFLIIILSVTAFCAGCQTEIKPDSADSGKYATQTADSAIEYSLFMNKQITVFTNQLNTRMTVAHNLQSSSYENEIYLTRQSIQTLEDALEEVTVTMPGKTTEDDREAVMTAMQTAIDHMYDYIDALENGEDLEKWIDAFENDFFELTGLATLYYQ